jgi:site-specific DNA recombinase
MPWIKIDLIVTKSVSRFARNTVDSLTTVRKLKDKGIEIYFEKENIWTLDAKGELLITIMSSRLHRKKAGAFRKTLHGGIGNVLLMVRSAYRLSSSLGMTKGRTAIWLSTGSRQKL